MKIILLNIIMAFSFLGLFSGKTKASAVHSGTAALSRISNLQVRKIRITYGKAVLTATLLENKTAEDFYKQLPLEIRMDDLFNREKYGNIPKPLSIEGTFQSSYETGDIGYWSPGTDIAIYYQNDHEKIPNPGIILIARLDKNVSALDVRGTVKVRIEAIN